VQPEALVAADKPRPRRGNRLLAALPEHDFEKLSTHLIQQSVPRGHILQRRDQPLRVVYFPDESLCWLTNATEDGSTAQVAMVGQEGIVGVEAVFGSRIAMTDAFVHVSCENVGRSLSMDIFRREFERQGAFYSLIHQYAASLMGFLSRSAMCNAWHTAEERCCRWLLEAAIRVGQPELCVTHEVISDLLGLRRSTVTLILGRLSDAGVISTGRGVIHIENREALEARSCNCYKLVTTVFKRLPATHAQFATN
jgi:CRP-like cAMP-binding protein